MSALPIEDDLYDEWERWAFEALALNRNNVGVYNTARKMGYSDLQARRMANSGRIDTPEKAKAYNEARRQGADDTTARRVSNSPSRKGSSSSEVKKELDKERSNTQKTADAIRRSNPAPSSFGSPGARTPSTSRDPLPASLAPAPAPNTQFGSYSINEAKKALAAKKAGLDARALIGGMELAKTRAGIDVLDKRRVLGAAQRRLSTDPNNRTYKTDVVKARQDFEKSYEDWRIAHWSGAYSRCPECAQAVGWVDPQMDDFIKRSVGETIGKAPIPVPGFVKSVGGFAADLAVGAVTGENMTGHDIANSAVNHFTGVDPDKLTGDPGKDVLEIIGGFGGKVFSEMGMGGGVSRPPISPGEQYTDIPGTKPFVVNFAGTYS